MKEREQGFNPNPELRSEIKRRRQISETMLEKHGAFRDENGVLQPTEKQIERIKQEGERYLDQQMWEMYELFKESVNSKVKKEATGELSREDRERLNNMSKEEKKAFIGRRMAQEKSRFLSGEIDNPSFSYIELEEVDYETIRANLDDAKQWYKQIITQSKQKETLKGWYIEKINEQIVRLEVNRSIRDGNDKKLSRYAKFLHGEPNDEVQRICEQTINQYLENDFTGQQETEKEFDAEEIAQYFEAALTSYALDFKVEIREDRETIAVSSSERVVKVPASRKVFFDKLRKLITHEIETHALRKKSGEKHQSSEKKWPEKGRVRLLKEDTLPRYIETEEGLALYNQQMLFGKVPEKPEDLTIWIRTLGLCWAKDNNFRGTFDQLTELVEEIYEKADKDDSKEKAQEVAWVTCARLFRGFSDTSEPGNYDPRYYRYLKGNIAVWDYMDQGGDINKLYIGKIGINHIQQLHEMGINEPAITPRFIASEAHKLSEIIDSNNEKEGLNE